MRSLWWGDQSGGGKSGSCELRSWTHKGVWEQGTGPQGRVWRVRLLQAPEKGHATIRTGCRCFTLVSTWRTRGREGGSWTWASIGVSLERGRDPFSEASGHGWGGCGDDLTPGFRLGLRAGGVQPTHRKQTSALPARPQPPCSLGAGLLPLFQNGSLLCPRPSFWHPEPLESGHQRAALSVSLPPLHLFLVSL